ncbi:MAG TPA: PadR family transcriptional regulator [Promineifilum sp.]
MKPENDDISDLLPLREPTFYILLSLAEGEKHGYAIIKDVAEISRGKVTLSTGTLYEALARLLDQRLIERVMLSGGEGAAGQHPGRPRKAYRLTLRGGQVMRAETARLDVLLATARGRMGLEA